MFLDEIGELDLDLQTKLLQVVQEHSMRSIGSTEYTSVNIRIIAATNLQSSRDDKGRAVPSGFILQAQRSVL